MQAQFQPLFLVVDVANSSLYERDPDDPCWKSGVWITI